MNAIAYEYDLLPDDYTFKLSRQHYAAANISPDTNHEGKWQAAILPQGVNGSSIYWLQPRYGLAFNTQGEAIDAATKELEKLYQKQENRTGGIR
jgi:hypothetical protein